MQEFTEYATRRRVGCVMWIAIVALLLASANFMWNLIQEIAWDAAVQQATTGAAAPQQVLQPVEAAPAQALPPVDPTPAQQSAAAPASTPISPVTAALKYADVCGIDESNLTEVQLTQTAQRFVGREFANWEGYVYDVQQREGQYVVEVADEPRGFMWNRSMVLYGVPSEVAAPLTVEQRIVFSGHIREVEVMLGQICIPITLDISVLTPQ